jgi:hypothetical protein
MDTQDRNAQIIAMVKAGLTYTATAQALGITRNAVAGVCDRAGVKTGPRFTDEQRSAYSAHMTAYQARKRQDVEVWRHWYRRTCEGIRAAKEART